VSLFRRSSGVQQRAGNLSAYESVADATSARMRTSNARVDEETARRHSAVWASLRLRANLVSTLPFDVFRKVADVDVEVPKPPVLVNPGGERVDIMEWLYSTQNDLDLVGNAFGLITERNANKLPARIDLVPARECAVIPAGHARHGTDLTRMPEGWKYRICGEEYYPDEVWHEKQYTVSGLPVGLSPVAYAAWTVGEYLSIQDFANDWFGGGGVPLAHLKNTAKTLSASEARNVKDRFKATIQAGDVFVSGSDWEYEMIQSQEAGSSWLEAKQASVSDVARFFDVPGDLIDAAIATGNITYANGMTRNLQFLVMHLNPTLRRREFALSKLVPRPREVRFNRKALLEMDPHTQAEYLSMLITNRVMTPDEARGKLNLQPLEQDQIDQLDHFFPPGADAFGGGFGEGPETPAAAG